jgi:hypothetical protein
MRLTILLAALFMLGGTAGAQPPKQAPKKTEELIGEASRRMNGILETKDFQEKMPFSKFLQLLEKEIAKEKPFSIHFDREAFGKDADKMLNAEVNLPPVPARMVRWTALPLALAQTHIDGQEIEFTARPGTLVITTRDRSLFTASYEIGVLLKHTRYLHDNLRESNLFAQGVFFLIGPEAPAPDLKADPAKPDEWIVRQVIALANAERAGWRNRTLASTLRIANGTKLVVHTAPSVHNEIDQLLATMRILTDPAVVVNAKVYALDRAEYDMHFAASFVDPKDKSARLAARATDAQIKMLQTRKPILEGDADKLRPNERGVFLSLRNAYQFQAGPGNARPTTAFEGFSFSVRPILSPDRRCLRLELFHDVEQLVKLTKGTMIDQKTGKELQIELPNLRKSASSGVIEIHDGQALLLAVDYRPKDKVWIVLAEPMIYMEEEQAIIRKLAIKPMPHADEKPAPPDPPLEPEKEPIQKPPVQLPDTDEARQILQAVVESVLTDPDLKTTRDFYGTPKEGKFALDDGQIPWPKDLRPMVAGYTQVQRPPECRFGPQNRLMGVRLDQFGWDGKKAIKEFSIDVAISNVGGSTNGAVIGGCFANYTAKHAGKKWVAQLNSVFDP